MATGAGSALFTSSALPGRHHIRPWARRKKNVTQLCSPPPRVPPMKPARVPSQPEAAHKLPVPQPDPQPGRRPPLFSPRPCGRYTHPPGPGLAPSPKSGEGNEKKEIRRKQTPGRAISRPPGQGHRSRERDTGEKGECLDSPQVGQISEASKS